MLLASIMFPTVDYSFVPGASRTRPGEFERRTKNPREDSEQ